VVLFTKQRNNSFCCNRRVVMRNFGKEVMSDVIRRDVMEKVGTNDSEVTIDGSSGAADETPCIGTVLGHLWMCMMKISYHDCR
jgi:hypothetical protein